MFFKSNIISVAAVISACIFAALLSFNCSSKDSAGEVAAELHSDENVLGRYLFFDRRLSINNTRSCATCHNPQFAFTDGYKRSLGIFADLHQRNTQPLFNLDQMRYLTGADSTIHTLLQQMDNPLFNEHPSEMGVKGNESEILKRISDDSQYRQLFKKTGRSITWNAVKEMIVHFVRGIHSYGSTYDKYKNGDRSALSNEEVAGMKLFFSDSLNCSKCHGGENFSSPELKDSNGKAEFYFNTGLYNVDGKGAYPSYDRGLYNITLNPRDEGKFRVPSLRNLAYTAPYFHDGSAASPGEVIDAYARGGRKISTGIYKGDGRENPYRHPLIRGFTITEADRRNLVSFLLSLSDSTIVTNPAYSNPFNADETVKKP